MENEIVVPKIEGRNKTAVRRALSAKKNAPIREARARRKAELEVKRTKWAQRAAKREAKAIDYIQKTGVAPLLPGEAAATMEQLVAALQAQGFNSTAPAVIGRELSKRGWRKIRGDRTDNGRGPMIYTYKRFLPE